MMVVGGLLLSALVIPLQTKAAASWPDWANVGANMGDDPLDTFVWQEIKAIIMDVLKKKAMDLFRKKVMEAIGDEGGLVGNFGKYIYASGDSAAAQFWNSFLANCTNIDPTVSLAVKYEAVDRVDQYDWCPVHISSGGVDLGEINISEERGWENFGQMIAYNDPFWTFFKAVDQVEQARAETETVYILQALTGDGGIAPTTEAGSGAYDETSPDFIGPPRPPAETESSNIKTYAKQFSTMLDAATNGTTQVQANYQGFLSVIINAALDYFIEETLGEDAF